MYHAIADLDRNEQRDRWHQAEGVNLIEICWGRVTGVRIYHDTAALERTLHRIAAKGTEEAWASPIAS